MPKRKSRPQQASKASTTPHVDRANEYVAGVLSGKIVACKWIRLACQRHVDDLERAKGDWPYYFSPEQAERVCKFIEFLPHVKGKWARKKISDPSANKIRLEGWQCFIVASLFGWLVKGSEREVASGRVVGLRRYVEADLWVARKNAKSTLAVGIAHWMLSKDEEPGAECYCGATSEKQIMDSVFRPAQDMMRSEPELQAQLGVEVNARNIIHSGEGGMSKLEPVIGKPGDGTNPHLAIIDEYHEHATSEQLDTFKTGMGSREQPLLLVISTAGFNISGPAHDRWKEGEKILERVYDDDRRFVCMYTLDSVDEWMTETGMKKANPNWGVSVDAASVMRDMEQAKREASKQTAFKTKHGNIWVSSSSAFFNLEYWKKCYDANLSREQFVGRACVMAGDLASKIDLVARVDAFATSDDRIAVFAKYYLPEETVSKTENQHYQKWATEGWLTVTPGAVTDLEKFRDDILEDCSKYAVKELACDPWNAQMLLIELRNKGVNAYEMRQNVQNLSEPMKNLDAMMRAGKIVHDGNPITSWCLSNVVAQLDNKDNVFPKKDKPQQKIDGAVAMIMAVGRLLLQPKEASSDGGVIWIDM